RARRDEARKLLGIRHESVLRPTWVVHGTSAVQCDGRRPKRVVRTRHQHFIAAVEERAQHEVDELAHPVADEDLLGRDAGDAPRLLLHDHRFPRREDALLMAIALGLGEVLDHRQAHGLRCPEPERLRVADVEGDDLIALPLELVGAAREAATDLVTDVAQTLARTDAGVGLHITQGYHPRTPGSGDTPPG